MKKLCLLLIIATTTLLGADKIRPLSDAVSAMDGKSGEMDFSEVAYVGSRCAALYICVGDYIVEGAREEADKKYGELFKKRAEVFWKVATVLSAKLKMSPENVEKRVKMFIDHYSKEMAENKRLNNIAITELITADLDQAKKVFPMFDMLAQEIEKNSKDD